MKGRKFEQTKISFADTANKENIELYLSLDRDSLIHKILFSLA